MKLTNKERKLVKEYTNKLIGKRLSEEDKKITTGSELRDSIYAVGDSIHELIRVVKDLNDKKIELYAKDLKRMFEKMRSDLNSKYNWD